MTPTCRSIPATRGLSRCSGWRCRSWRRRRERRRLRTGHRGARLSARRTGACIAGLRGRALPARRAGRPTPARPTRPPAPAAARHRGLQLGRHVADGTACGGRPVCSSGACVAVSAGCGAASAAPTGTLSLSVPVRRATRSYLAMVAGDLSSTPLPLTFVYHGVGGTSSGATSFGLQDAPGAAAAGIFVFPQGVDFTENGTDFGIGWNEHCDGYDMPFFDAMVQALSTTYCVDLPSIFVAGFSWGGDFANNLGCCRGDRVRAVAPDLRCGRRLQPLVHQHHAGAAPQLRRQRRLPAVGLRPDGGALPPGTTLPHRRRQPREPRPLRRLPGLRGPRRRMPLWRPRPPVPSGLGAGTTSGPGSTPSWEPTRPPRPRRAPPLACALQVEPLVRRHGSLRVERHPEGPFGPPGVHELVAQVDEGLIDKRGSVEDPVGVVAQPGVLERDKGRPVVHRRVVDDDVVEEVASSSATVPQPGSSRYWSTPEARSKYPKLHPHPATRW